MPEIIARSVERHKHAGADVARLVSATGRSANEGVPMPYVAEISRTNPSCFIFLVDQSASMVDSIGGEVRVSKADVVADALNRLLTELAIRCAKEEGVRDYFHVAVLGYGGRSAQSAFGGGLQGRDLVAISQVADHPLRVDQRTKLKPDGAGGVIELKTDFPVWVEALANGATPMCQALMHARNLVSAWIAEHPRGFPPIVLNLTDGEANDGDPLDSARQLTQLRTDDGAVLLFNLHISDAGGSPITFPADTSGCRMFMHAASSRCQANYLHTCARTRPTITTR